ncbi:hypothetical protein ACLOJK_030607 [Asimina triloba]
MAKRLGYRVAPSNLHRTAFITSSQTFRGNEMGLRQAVGAVLLPPTSWIMDATALPRFSHLVIYPPLLHAFAFVKSELQLALQAGSVLRFPTRVPNYPAPGAMYDTSCCLWR